MQSVLLVIFENDLYKSLKANFDNLGVKTHKADSLNRALSEVSKNNPNLIILDMSFPGLDGHEFSYLVSEKLEKNIPLLVLAGSDNLAYQDGVSKVLIKGRTTVDEIVQTAMKYLV